MPVPPGQTDILDITGMIVTPGLIDCRSTLWLTSMAIEEAASDAGLDVLDGIDPHSDDWREVALQGVTAVYVQPSSRGLLGGRGAVLRVGPAETVEDIVLKANAAAQAIAAPLSKPAA